MFTVRHSARIHGDLLVSFTDSCVSLACSSHEGLFLGHLHGVYLVGLDVLLRALPGLLSFALTSGHDSTVLIPPAIDFGGVGPVSLVYGGFDPLLLRCAWWSSGPGWLLHLSLAGAYVGAFLNWTLAVLEAGLTSRPLLALPGLVYCMACSLDSCSSGFLR